MNWRPAGAAASRALARRLNNDEWRQVALSSRLKEAGGIARFGQIADGRLWVRSEERVISGGLFFSRWGVMLPVFEAREMDSKDRTFLRKLLFSRRDTLFSIIGTKERVCLLENLLGESPPDYESYQILTGPSLPFLGNEPSKSIGEIRIHRAGPADKELLWPIEQAYQLEEVLRSGSTLNEHSARRFFLTTLRHQLVYYATLNGKPIAKVNTNARGNIYDQIGGVYVVPTLRGKGIAGRLIQELLSVIHSEGRRSCLFVKKSNTAALRLYEKLRFRDRGPFRISYWGH